MGRAFQSGYHEESDTVMGQIANNTEEKAMLGSFPKAVGEAVMNSGDIDQKLMLQLLSDPEKSKGFARIVFGLLKLAG